MSTPIQSIPLKTIDGVPYLIATEAAVVKRFGHLHRKLWF